MSFRNHKILFVATSIFWLICLSESNLNAQYLGAYVGVNNGKIVGDLPSNYNLVGDYSLLGGALFETKIAKDVQISLQPGVIGSRMRLQVPNEEEDALVDSLVYKLLYLDLPIIFKIVSKNEKLYFSSGIILAWKIKMLETGGTEEVDISSQFKTMNVSVAFAIGYQIPIGRPKLYFEMRYVQGMLNISETDSQQDLVPRSKIRGVQLSTGILFPLSKSEK